jgi:hypothetical protein
MVDSRSKATNLSWNAMRMFSTLDSSTLVVAAQHSTDNHDAITRRECQLHRCKQRERERRES